MYICIYILALSDHICMQYRATLLMIKRPPSSRTTIWPYAYCWVPGGSALLCAMYPSSAKLEGYIAHNSTIRPVVFLLPLSLKLMF